MILDAKNRTITKAAYLGYLLVTCYSAHSRNRSLGFLIRKGLPLPEALSQTKMVAEGYNACASIYKLLFSLKRNYDAPILNCVYNIMQLGNDPQTEITILTPLIS